MLPEFPSAQRIYHGEQLRNFFMIGTDPTIKTQNDIFEVFDQVQPRGASFSFRQPHFLIRYITGRTPTGAKLRTILGKVVDKLDKAMDTPAYGQIKPVDIIVLTDGIPTDDPASVIQTAAERLTDGMHHLNAVGIQFVQIGNDEGADQALMQLCKGPVRVSGLLVLILPVLHYSDTEYGGHRAVCGNLYCRQTQKDSTWRASSFHSREIVTLQDELPFFALRGQKSIHFKCSYMASFDVSIRLL
jgi:hypothetical protein